jgi:hypothetical protein
MTDPGFGPGGTAISERRSVPASFLQELLGYAADAGLVFGEIEDCGGEARVSVAAAPVARLRLACWQTPSPATLTELGLEGHPFERAGCWPVGGEPPAVARARGSAAECAAMAAAALRIGEVDAAGRLLSEALRHLAANPA